MFIQIFLISQFLNCNVSKKTLFFDFSIFLLFSIFPFETTKNTLKNKKIGKNKIFILYIIKCQVDQIG